MIIDASNAILGRMAVFSAKKLMEGEKVDIINAEKAVISGSPESVKQRFREKRARGDPIHGPFYPKMPDQIVRRAVRGMLPYKKTTGRDAYKKLKVYIGTPENVKGEAVRPESISADRLKCKRITINEISKELGANIRW